MTDATADLRAPAHLVGAGVAAAALVAVHGVAGAIVAVAVAATWALVGPVYAFGVGQVGLVAAAAASSLLGGTVRVLLGSGGGPLSAGTASAAVVVQVGLVAIPLVAFGRPALVKTLGALAVVGGAVAAGAAGAALWAGQQWVAAPGGVAVAALAGYVVYRYELVALERVPELADDDGGGADV